MKCKIFTVFLLLILIVRTYGQKNDLKTSPQSFNYVEAFKDTLVKLAENSDNAFFKMHCNSMLSVIGSRNNITLTDSAFLKKTYEAFNNAADPGNAKKLSSYLERRRPFIFAWVSPTDGAVSFSLLNPPKNWDPEKEYPVYIQLHGLWDVAANPLNYMTYPFIQGASSDSSFEDGYLLSPWGRGNLWYQGISETDIWECKAALEKIVKINPSRQYLSGHSMGGYGAWSIASKSPGIWAALGIHAGALWYNNSSLVNSYVAEILKDVPTYFVCGTNDGLLTINQTAYNLLHYAGNKNIKFVTFVGGHEYKSENVENMYLWMRNFVNEDVPVSTREVPEISPTGLRIECQPNPVSTTTSILFSGPVDSDVKISIFDNCGRLIEEFEDKVKISGENCKIFDASSLNAGIYLVQLRSGDRMAASKMIVHR